LTRALVAAVPALVLLFLVHVNAAADPPPPPIYADAVHQAYDIVQGASGSDTAPATAALRVSSQERAKPAGDHRRPESAATSV